jgi:hypothetical protein
LNTTSEQGNPLDLEHACPHRRLAREMAELCEPRIYKPAVAYAHGLRVKNAQLRRKQRSQFRARVRRHHGRTIHGVQYKPPCFGPLPPLKK